MYNWSFVLTDLPFTPDALKLTNTILRLFQLVSRILHYHVFAFKRDRSRFSIRNEPRRFSWLFSFFFPSFFFFHSNHESRSKFVVERKREREEYTFHFTIPLKIIPQLSPPPPKLSPPSVEYRKRFSDAQRIHPLNLQFRLYRRLSLTTNQN